jgi:putative aldouronate transport system permease protein
MFKRMSKGDIIFAIFNYTFLSLLLLIIIYPLYFIVIASVSNPELVSRGEVWLLPKGLTLDGYRRIMSYTQIWTGYRNTIFYTVLGTSISVSLTLTSAYALSRKDLYGRNVIMAFLAFTMFFSGGLIPTYLLVKSLKLTNTVWALVLPNAVWVYNVIISRTFFASSIPSDLLESAQLDGCSNTRFFFQIVLPLSKPVISVMALFYAVGQWNNFFDALIYLRKESLYPLQLILRSILLANSVDSSTVTDASSVDTRYRIAEMIKYGSIIVSTLPIIAVYPFLQKNFAKGVMIGAVKG